MEVNSFAHIVEYSLKRLVLNARERERKNPISLNFGMLNNENNACAQFTFVNVNKHEYIMIVTQNCVGITTMLLLLLILFIHSFVAPTTQIHPHSPIPFHPIPNYIDNHFPEFFPTNERKQSFLYAIKFNLSATKKQSLHNLFTLSTSDYKITEEEKQRKIDKELHSLST